MAAHSKVKTASKRLFEIAEQQLGFFTAKQAIAAGFASNNHSYYVHQEHWNKVGHGLYRLKQFPRAEFEDLMKWFLWSRNKGDSPQGVFSHQTALDLYEISDISPPKIHMTVPKNFRRSQSIPSVLCLHKADLQKADVKVFHGFAITTPIRTLVDLITEARLSPEMIEQAVTNAYEKGLITGKQINSAPTLKPYVVFK